MDGSYAQPRLDFTFEQLRRVELLGNTRFEYLMTGHLAAGLADWEICQNTRLPAEEAPDLPAMSVEPEVAAAGLLLSYGGSGHGAGT